MLFQTRFHDEELPSVRSVSCVLHHNTQYRQHKEMEYHFFPWHCHNFFELQFFYNVNAEDSSEVCHYKQNTLQLFHPLQTYSCEDIGFEYLLLLQISPGFIRRNLSSIPAGKTLSLDRSAIGKNGIVVGEESRLCEILKNIAVQAPVYLDTMQPEDYNTKFDAHYTPARELNINGMVLRLLAELLLLNIFMIDDENTRFNSTELMGLVNQIVSNPAEKISMQQAADMMHMSYSDFSRYFKQVMGSGFVEFCNSVRVNESQNLLMMTQKSTGEIAEMLGFGSHSYFNRIFQQYTGCTPSQFRAARHKT